ncbi:MAG: ankyrin repeat domain-containing protein [Legionella sp.]|nr:ankyrin repeat domain-containing protein [Legionella sp.]
MPKFTDLFFKPLKIELNEEEQCQLTEILQEIYGGKCVNYETLSDFEQCKTQLLALLDHIVDLDSSRMHLFGRYREMVASLSSEGAESNIAITLRSAKKSIESCLLAIKKNHAVVDKTALDNLVVEKCYAGAFSNIEYALGFFRVDALAFYIEQAKSLLIWQLAQQYLLDYDLVPEAGNDIHYANGLYNLVAEGMGLKLKEDPLLGCLDPLLNENFAESLELTVANFIRVCLTCFPLPPATDIKNAEDLKKLTDFFVIFEKNGVSREKYLRLYNEDIENNALTPKPEFSLFCTALLAAYLEEKGYLKDMHLLKERSLFYSGEALVGINQDGTYRALTDEELLSDQIKPKVASLSLWSQITPETLLRLYKESRDRDSTVYSVRYIYSQRYFSALLTKPSLPPLILNTLLEVITGNNNNDDERSQLADYVFTNPQYELTSEQLDFFAIALPKEKTSRCLTNLVKTDKTHYVRSLLENHPENLTKNLDLLNELSFLAASSGAVNFMLLLIELNVLSPLTIKDTYGASLAHYAARKGHVAILETLRQLKIPLDVGDVDGLTPAHYAAQFGQIAILEKFKEWNIPLDVKNNYGSTLAHCAAANGKIEVIEWLKQMGVPFNEENELTPAHYAARFGQVEILEKLPQLGISLNKGNSRGLMPAHLAAATGQIEVLERLHQLEVPLNVRNHKDSTPAHAAAQYGQIAVLKKLAQLRVPLDDGNHKGSTPAHHAAKHNQPDVLEALFKLNVPLDARDKTGLTPAHYAALRGNVAALEKLHKLGIPLNTKDNEGFTPAHHAAKNNQPDVLAKLLELGVTEIEVRISSSASSSFFQPVQKNDGLVSQDEALDPDLHYG